jgi:L-seryl-tRNA(Ser) seleniumtransferase
VDVDQTAFDLARGLLRSATHPVINASGVLLHTNLGRAPLSARAAEAARLAASSYTNLELDLSTGERGRRGSYVTELLRALTGAESAMVVNNNAAAVLLALAATSAGKAVPVSRGELIEIGGSYRLPLVTTTGGARLVEVGTTNRTRLGDYGVALQINDCGAVLKVHPSNYRIEGFVETVEVADLAALAHEKGVPLIFDVGSGLIDEDAPWLGKPLPGWLSGEPGVRQAIEDGADLVTFSGDKLVGGPQAGIAVGAAKTIDRLRRHPLARALRVDAMTDAALGATLEALAGDDPREIPLWRMATLPADDLRRRANVLAGRLGGSVGDSESVIGAGSFPGVGIPTPQVTLEGEDHLYGRLLETERPILTRRLGKDLVVDLRAVAPEDDDLIADMVARCR